MMDLILGHFAGGAEVFGVGFFISPAINSNV
jgi:hypothetical protein